MDTNPMDQAAALIRAGKIAEAQEILHPFIRANPQNVDAWLLEAETWNTAGQIRVLQLCLERNPGNVRAQQALTNLLAAHRDRMLELAYEVKPQYGTDDTTPGSLGDLLARFDRLRGELEQSRRLMEQMTRQFDRLQAQADRLRRELAKQIADPKQDQ